MKAIITFTTMCALLCVSLVKGQSNPPSPPVVSSHSDVTSSQTSSSYSVTSSDDDAAASQGGNISISINDSNGSYSLHAKFPERKTSEVHNILQKELGEGTQVNGKIRYRWVLNAGSEEVYEVDLRKNKLAIALDKDVAGEELIAQFKSMGKLIRNAISGKDVDAALESQHLQREADRLQREADRMRRESERMQREADRLKRDQSRIQDQNNRNVSRYERDALRLAEEGMRVAEEACRVGQDAVNGGGVSDMVEKLLALPRTQMNLPFENTNNWTWPSTQTQLLETLATDKLITSDAEVVFSKEQTAIFVNGTKMSSRNMMHYYQILLNNKIPINYNFTFYKKGNNIVIIDSMAKIEPLLRDMQRNGFIENLNTAIEIEINGASVKIGGKEQTANHVSEINTLLRKHNIIAAPSKTIKISGTGSYTLGYTNGKAHIGTWVARD